MPTTPQESSRDSLPHFQNVAQRLAQAIGTAKEMGFDVRKVVFDDQTPGWCQIGEKKILFLDLTASTAEQLNQLDDIIASYCNQKSQRESGKLAA
ncbi:MAG: hypothetical protein KDB00_20465 [Planctomycetales bacterium]|nr:hypothetical protein [Planctomycetales bacterium]